ncbi:MAG TPA: glycoside hydrolase family 140 protein [Terracidiphilus sp.]
MQPEPGSSRRSFLKTRVGAAFAAGTPSVTQSQVTAAAATCNRPLPRITVHADGHLLCGDDGSPFFWLGDTAWQLIQETTRDECSYYLHTRARQGFTVIQTVVLAEFDGVKQTTTERLLPFADQDPSRPNDPFFDRVVEIVEEAGRLGLYVALLPTWGDKLTAPWGAGPRLFRTDNLDVAQGYARYLANKLKAHFNVLWILGGDRPPRTEAEDTKPAQDWTPIWRALADGLNEGLGSRPTIVYHPSGGSSSSRWLHNEPWLSVNGMQSGHGGGHDVPVWDMISHDYALSPPKPTVDLEPNYEDHPYNPWPQWDPAIGYFRDHDVRKQVYRSVFAGGCGVTYGHHAVWQFANRRHPVENHADRDWIDALYRPAARQMAFLRFLIESRPFFARIPDQSLIAGDPGRGGLHLQATRDRDGSYAFIYFPMMDLPVTIDLSRLRATHFRAWWYDPRTGVATPGSPPLTAERTEFRSPPYGPDWVLVIDDISRNYAPPGLTRLA